MPGQHTCHICARVYKYRRGLQRHYRLLHAAYWSTVLPLVETVHTARMSKRSSRGSGELEESMSEDSVQ
ncbi:hypothetical protein J6590_002394 [Homalodisca vitripennis]|nr:hypothetical protein J6590_002394 [Homalodisca vitripennis]